MHIGGSDCRFQSVLRDWTRPDMRENNLCVGMLVHVFGCCVGCVCLCVFRSVRLCELCLLCLLVCWLVGLFVLLCVLVCCAIGLCVVYVVCVGVLVCLLSL